MPDLVIANARLVLDPVAPELVDVAIADGRIVSVASTVHFGGRNTPDSTKKCTVDGEEVVDAEGRWLIPGLWDEHVHFEHWASSRRRIDLSAAESAAEAAAIITAAAPAGDGVVVGRSFRDALWPDAPDRALLDAAFPDRPVVLDSADLLCLCRCLCRLTRYRRWLYPRRDQNGSPTRSSEVDSSLVGGPSGGTIPKFGFAF